MTNKTTFVAYAVTGDDDNKFWNRIGSAWKHADGNGFNIQLFATPLDGQIVLREPSDKKSSEDKA